MHRRFRRAVLTSMLAAAALAAGAATAHATGLDDLIDRLGAGNVPTGVNVSVAQVEVPDSQGDYGPDQSHAMYDGITFHEQSGPTGNNGHAHFVGRRIYGDVSIASGINDVWLYDLNHWLSTYLRVGTSFEPFSPPGGIKIFNHSWVADFSDNAIDNEVLRRVDRAMIRDEILMVVGVGNDGDPNRPLLSHNYNGITVGKPDGTHVSDDTLSVVDGGGRMKPEITTQTNLTSYSTGAVTSAAALLVDTARTTPTLGINPAAERPEVVKAALLAGAQKTAGWSNNPGTSGASRGITTRPIDSTVGAGDLDINLAHLVLTGGEQDGTLTVPGAVNIQHVGWDLTHAETGESVYYRFRIYDQADEVSIVATWMRRVNSSFTAWSIADYNLCLHRVDDAGQLHPLTGDAGLGVFAGGNVVSESGVDNIEHLYITGLMPCEYVLELSRDDTLPGAVQRDVAIAWRMPAAPTCLADISEADDAVNVFDLLELLSSWGACPDGCPSQCRADINGDDAVDVFDLLDLLSAWGPCD